MPNRMKMKSKKNNTLISLGSELIRVEINLLIEGIELMLLSGLIIFRVLRDLRLTDD